MLASIPDKNRKRAQRSDQNSGRKRVRREVEDLAHDHCSPLAMLLFPLNCRACVLVTMPAHHVGFFRYEKPSPSNPCFSAEAVSPFFVITKLVPGSKKFSRLR